MIDKGKRVDIQPRGEGYPAVGHYVPGDDGKLYQVQTEGSRIETDRCGVDVCVGYVLGTADWSDPDSDDDIYPCLAMVSHA